MGCGRVGSSLARSLEKRGHTVAVIDLNSEAFRRLGPDFAGKTVRGVGFDREVGPFPRTPLDVGVAATIEHFRATA